MKISSASSEGEHERMADLNGLLTLNPLCVFGVSSVLSKLNREKLTYATMGCIDIRR